MHMDNFPKLVIAEIPGQANRVYLVDQHLDFIAEVKELVDQKVNSRCAPGTIKLLCIRLRWYYRFLAQRQLNVLEVTSADLSEFVLWLSNPHRDGQIKPQLLQASTINQILNAVANLYKFLVRRGRLTQSPVLYESVARMHRAAVDGDLLAHTRRGSGQMSQRMELKLKTPKSIPKTVSAADFEQFVRIIHVGHSPLADPAGFRDRLMVVFLRESGLRCGELLGIRMEDLDFGLQGVHVKFRPDNANGSRAKAGYGRDRFVSLPPDVLGLLDLYLTEIWVNVNAESDYLWLVLKANAVNHDGQRTFGAPLTQAAINSMFVYYSKRSGVKIHPHMLRHTHATELVRFYLNREEPVDWLFISNRLGHSNLVTTMQTYTHLTKEDNKAAYRRYLTQRREIDAKRRQSNYGEPAMDSHSTDFS